MTKLTTKADSGNIFVPYQSQPNPEELAGRYCVPTYIVSTESDVPVIANSPIPVTTNSFLSVKDILSSYSYINLTPTSTYARLQSATARVVIVENVGSGIIFIRKTGVDPAIQIASGKSREFVVLSNLNELDIRSDNGITPVQIEIRA